MNTQQQGAIKKSEAALNPAFEINLESTTLSFAIFKVLDCALEFSQRYNYKEKIIINCVSCFFVSKELSSINGKQIGPAMAAISDRNTNFDETLLLFSKAIVRK